MEFSERRRQLHSLGNEEKPRSRPHLQLKRRRRHRNKGKWNRPRVLIKKLELPRSRPPPHKLRRHRKHWPHRRQSPEPPLRHLLAINTFPLRPPPPHNRPAISSFRSMVLWLCFTTSPKLRPERRSLL